MELEENDIQEITEYFYGKKTQEVILLKNLLKHKIKENIPSSELKKINNIPQKKSNLKTKLISLGYTIEGTTYRIKKLKEENLETLINEINSYLFQYKKLFNINNIKIFNSYENAPIKNLSQSLQKIKKINSDCTIEITTLFNDSIENDLIEIKNNVNPNYFRLFKLIQHIEKEFNIFFVIIYTNNEEELFLYDNKNYITFEAIKNSYIASVLNNYYKTNKTKHIKFDKIKSNLNKEEIDSLIENILYDIKELKRKSKNKEENIYKLLENIFVHT